MPSSEKAKKKKSPRHVCNPNDVATAKYLATTTKACPRCHASIQRESGCAQMLCTKCHTVFNWNTLKEETGVIHNPHFYQLGTEMRQRIVDERASRGIAAGRETRFLAGVAPHGGGCDAEAEHDPLCVEFTSPVFMRLLERALKDDAALLRGAMDVHRHAVHCAQVEIPGIDYMLDNPHRFGEQRTRDMRLAYLNGGKPVKLLEEISAAMHPLKFKSSMLIVVDGEKKVTLENFKKQLMRCDTERTKLMKKAELIRTFMAASEDALRLALASVPAELKVLVGSAIEMKKTLERELDALNGTVAGRKREREEAGDGNERLTPVPPPLRLAPAPPLPRLVVRVPATGAPATAAPQENALALAKALFGDDANEGESEEEDAGGDEDEG